jgi:16S rRNA (guanine966-N2)-methyltransferase
MRIIGGRFKRRPIKAPPGNLTRPTTDRTRESLFNLVESRLDLTDVHVLDLFCGSGALGLEAISRGAVAVTFVDTDGRVLKVARENAVSLGVEDYCEFIKADAVPFVQKYRGPEFDLVIADPPYHLASMALLPDMVIPMLRPNGLFALEHDARIVLDHHPHLQTSRAYGRTIVSIFYPSPIDDEPSEESDEDS